MAEEYLLGYKNGGLMMLGEVEFSPDE